MAFKLLLILSTLVLASLGQWIECRFSWTMHGNYLCTLNISNPDGFDNFTSIGGTHWDRFGDENVTLLLTTGHSPNVPRIICDTFTNLNDATIAHFFPNEFDVDAIFGGCKNIQRISVDNQRVTSIGANVFSNNRNLRELLLSRNRLTELSATQFSNNQQLSYINLRSNRLTTLPAGIFQGLTSLRRIRLNSNQLKSLSPDIFQGLSQLSFLNLDHNQLTSLAPGIFQGTALQVLHINNNLLTVWHPQWLQNHPNIDNLSVHWNRFTTIPPGAFHPLHRLRTIRMHNNTITELRYASNLGGTELTQIFAENNRIEFIDRALLERPPFLATVHLLNNVCTKINFSSNFYRNREANLERISACFD